MDFLVRLDTTAVHQIPDRERKELVEREWMRGRELLAVSSRRSGVAWPESERRYLVGTRRRSAY
jgi:hypothetical protein